MRRSRTGPLLLAGCLAVTACSDDGDATTAVTVPAGETTSSSTTTSSTSSTTEDPTVAVEQAFYDQWDAFVEITSDPDVNNPLIDQFFTGDARTQLLDTISSDLAEGHATRLPDDPNHFVPSVESIELTGPNTASVIECTVDGLVVFDRASGAVVNDTLVTVRVDNDFELISGQWKVTRSGLLERWEGIDGCAS